MINKSHIFSKERSGRYGYLFGKVMYKCWAEIFQMEVFLNKHKPDTIIELGSGTGAFSLYLAIYSNLNDIMFTTIDCKEMDEDIKDLIIGLGGETLVGDVFSEDVIKYFSTKFLGKTLLYCDNGDKYKELEIYSEMTKKGDLIIVHDANIFQEWPGGVDNEKHKQKHYGKSISTALEGKQFRFIDLNFWADTGGKQLAMEILI